MPSDVEGPSEADWTRRLIVKRVSASYRVSGRRTEYVRVCVIKPPRVCSTSRNRDQSE